MNSKLPGPRSDKKGIEELVVWGRGERWVERSVQNSAASLLGEIFLDSMPGSLRQTVSLCSCLLAGAAAKVEAGEPQGHALHLFPLTKRGRGSRLRGGREGGKVRRTWTPCCCHRDTENWLRSSQEQTCTHTSEQGSSRSRRNNFCVSFLRKVTDQECHLFAVATGVWCDIPRTLTQIASDRLWVMNITWTGSFKTHRPFNSSWLYRFFHNFNQWFLT